MSDLHARVEETRGILERIARDFSPAVFASSLAAEDMVLTDLILRAGRWWWENPESKECGLHVVDGKLIRIKSVAA